MTQVRGQNKQQTPLSENSGPYILGLDIGTTSVGWAVIDSRNNKPVGLRQAGVRIFEAGVEGDIESGRDASRAAGRRNARLQRRQTWRRADRLRRTFVELQRHGLLPDGAFDSAARHELLLKLDAELKVKHVPKDDERAAQLLPYLLRSKGVIEPLTLLEFGRALFHLAQRRGYRSNRKTDQKPDTDSDDELDATGEPPKKRAKRKSKATAEQTSARTLNADQSANDSTASGKEDALKVKESISRLQQEMGTLTLGQFFATLDPLKHRIRQRWTGREMYLAEFERLWTEQSKHHPELTAEVKRAIHRAIFHQRKLKSQKGLVGKCELEPKRRRCAQALPIAQEFRIRQQVNHLKLREANGYERFLEADERNALIERLKNQQSLSFAKAREGLGKGAKFTVELDENGEDKLVGDRTTNRLRPIFGVAWDEFSEAQREQIVYDVLHFQDAEALARRAKRAWNLAPDAAKKLANTQLEPGYARHSKRALTKLAEQLRQPSAKDPQAGKSYMEAREAAGYGTSKTTAVHDLLPPVLKSMSQLRNPAVCRALTEVRKVVNALIRKFGKPDVIRVELARDLKRSRKNRQEVSKANDMQRKSRERAKQRILSEVGIAEPRRSDIEKVLLAEECGWQCPFTGDSISMQSLLGPQPQFDVAHIFPRRYLDDSFVNKTLCRADVNRHRMHDLLPTQAFGQDAEKWDDILNRVRQFMKRTGRVGFQKLERFQMTEVPDDFVSRQLNDTRFTTSFAADYLACLYGGRWDESGRLRIQASTGGITAHLRNEWRLNSILGGGEKTRDDHRHHAVDAVAIALTSPGTQTMLQAAASRAASRFDRRPFAEVEEPWSDFLPQVREIILAIDGVRQAVSHRVNHKLEGTLHADTLYSPLKTHADGSTAHHVRKMLHKLSLTEVTGDKIVDPIIRELVQQQFERLKGTGLKDPAKAFADPGNHPYLTSKKGGLIPIHKVRLAVDVKPKTVGKGHRERFVAPTGGSNHHTVIIAELDEAAHEKRWHDFPTTRLDAYARWSENLKAKTDGDVIRRDWGPGHRFKFVLFIDDCIAMKDDSGVERIYRVANLSKGDIQLQDANDARDAKTLKAEKARIRVSAKQLKDREARKVCVTPLGEIVPDE